MNLPYNIIIGGAVNGFVVEAGCKRFVFTSASELITDLRGYLENPDAKVNEYATKYHDVAPHVHPELSQAYPQTAGVLVRAIPAPRPFNHTEPQAVPTPEPEIPDPNMF